MTRDAKRWVKGIVARLLYYAGVLQLLQRATLRQRAVVLMYHRVLNHADRTRTASHPGIVVSTEAFARQMALLKRRFTVLTADQFADHILRRVPFPDSSCLITFDDGWQDTLTNALPVLEREQLPSVVYLPANFIGGSRMFWRESLTHHLVTAILSSRREPWMMPALRLCLRDHGFDVLMDVTATNLREAAIDAIASQTALRATGAGALIAKLEGDFGCRVTATETPDVFLTWPEVAMMGTRRVAFGGHGAEHVRLAEMTDGEAAADIAASKRALDGIATGDVPSFSYPNGSFNPTVVAAVAAAGFKVAFSTNSGTVGCQDAPLTLKRINIHEDATATPALFLARLVGLF